MKEGSEGGMGFGKPRGHNHTDLVRLAGLDSTRPAAETWLMPGRLARDLWFEDEGNRLCLISAEGDGLFLRAVILLPRFYRVRAGRQAVQVKCAGLRGDREIGIVEDEEECAHPRMDVAHDGNGELGLVERGLGGMGGGGL